MTAKAIFASFHLTRFSVCFPKPCRLAGREKPLHLVRSREECSHATLCVAAEVSIHVFPGLRPTAWRSDDKLSGVDKLLRPSEEPNEAMADRGPDGRMVRAPSKLGKGGRP